MHLQKRRLPVFYRDRSRRSAGCHADAELGARPGMAHDSDPLRIELTLRDPRQFIFDHLNQIPKEAHGCDFARVKPWYLDGQAENLRQTVLLSRYEYPELRHLFNKQLVNVSGKVRTEQAYEGVLDRILPGVRQSFLRFEAPNAQSEDDARFEYFTKKVSPST